MSPMLGRSVDGMYRHLEELDRRATLARARAHRVQSLVSPPHRFLALEERHAEALARLAVDEHQHPRSLEAGRRVTGHLAPHHLDRFVNPGGIALECRNAREHGTPPR